MGRKAAAISLSTKVLMTKQQRIRKESWWKPLSALKERGLNNESIKEEGRTLERGWRVSYPEAHGAGKGGTIWTRP